MDIAIIGVGHVGLTTTVVLVEKSTVPADSGARAAIDAGLRSHGIGRGHLRS